MTGDHQGAASKDLSQEKLQMFDPSSLLTSDDFTFENNEVITQYLETYFRLSLNKDMQNTMHKVHLVPHTLDHEGAKGGPLYIGPPQTRFPKVT